MLTEQGKSNEKINKFKGGDNIKMKNYNGIEDEGITMEVEKVRELVYQRSQRIEDINSITREIVDHLTIDLWNDVDKPDEKKIQRIDGKVRPWDEMAIVKAVFAAIEASKWSVSDFLKNEDDYLIFNEL